MFNRIPGARPYSCHHCNRSFSSRSTLHGHRFVHMNNKPHQCTICEKGFIKRCYMVKHRAICMSKHQKKETVVQKKVCFFFNEKHEAQLSSNLLACTSFTNSLNCLFVQWLLSVVNYSVVHLVAVCSTNFSIAHL